MSIVLQLAWRHLKLVACGPLASRHLGVVGSSDQVCCAATLAAHWVQSPSPQGPGQHACRRRDHLRLPLRLALPRGVLRHGCQQNLSLWRNQQAAMVEVIIGEHAHFHAESRSNRCGSVGLLLTAAEDLADYYTSQVTSDGASHVASEIEKAAAHTDYAAASRMAAAATSEASHIIDRRHSTSQHPLTLHFRRRIRCLRR